MKNDVYKDSRLIEALDYIDGDLIGEVAMKLDPAKESAEFVQRKSTPMRHLKQIALIAACAVLLSAAFPIVSYILPRLGINIGGNAGAGSSHTYTDGNFIHYLPYGEIPEEFKTIVEQNLFFDVRTFGDKLYRYYRKDGINVFEIIDYSGEQVGKVELPTSAYGPLHSSHPTHDGNILAVFDCVEHSGCGDTRLVKFNTEGVILADTLADGVGVGCFEYGFLTEEGFIFVGSSASINKVFPSKYEITILEAGKDLNIKKKRKFGEDKEHSILRFAEYGQGKLSVYFSSSKETNDGLSDVAFYKYDFDADLNPVSESVIDKESIPNKADAIDSRYEEVIPERIAYCEIIDYGSFDLLVAEFGTSLHNMEYNCTHELIIDILYRETVYAAYSKDGELIWRGCVDSTYYEEQEEQRQAHERCQSSETDQ